MKKLIAIVFLVLALPSIALCEYSLPSDRSYPWAGAVGLGYCSDSQWYSKALCEADGDTWSTSIPERATICATVNIGDCSGTCDDEIQAQLNACTSGQTVLLGPGYFTTDTAISIPSNVTLRGSGPDQTFLRNTNAINIVLMSGSTNYLMTGADVGITAPSKGDTTIETASAHGFSVGDLILLDQLGSAAASPPTDPGDNSGEHGRDSSTRTEGQVVRVTSVPTSTTFTTELPIAFTFNSSLSPQAYSLTGQGQVTMAGLEDLTLDSSQAATESSNGSLYLRYTNNCWIKNVKVYKIGRVGVKPRITYRDYFFKMEVNDTLAPTGANSGYLLWVSYVNTGLLIENSIFTDGVDTVWTGANTANAFTYNYVYYTHNDANADDQGKGSFFHGAFPQKNLFEGNYYDISIGAVGDSEFGASASNTFFRNRFKASTNGGVFADALMNVMLIEGYSFNFVGNVFGTEGFETVYESTSNDDIYDGVKAIYHHQNSGNADELRHRNYDFVNDDVLTCVEGDATPPIADCQGGTTDTDLPDSLYLASKPSWMGNNTHPWVIAATGAADPTDLSAYVKYTTGNWIDDAPSILNIVIDANGQTVTFTASEALTQGTGYADSHLSMNCPSDADIGFTYVSGNTTSSLIYSTDHTVLDSDGNNCVFNFTGTANSLEDGDGNDLPAIVSQSIDNNSSQGATANTGRVMQYNAAGKAAVYNANGYQLVAP
ncbi:MAG: hypothetical protein ACU83N_15840 [Gammaproteobacteria bacterium]